MLDAVQDWPPKLNSEGCNRKLKIGRQPVCTLVLRLGLVIQPATILVDSSNVVVAVVAVVEDVGVVMMEAMVGMAGTRVVMVVDMDRVMAAMGESMVEDTELTCHRGKP